MAIISMEGGSMQSTIEEDIYKRWEDYRDGTFWKYVDGGLDDG